MRRALAFLGLALMAGPASPAVAHAASGSPAPQRPSVFAEQRLDANRVSMSVTNLGWFAFDFVAGSAGLEFPTGSGKTILYAGGLWLTGRVGGTLHSAVAEYSAEYLPGPIGGGPGLPGDGLYRLLKHYDDPAARDAALAEYDANRVSYGSPEVHVQPDGDLSIPGDQMIWCVFNDNDPNFHRAFFPHGLPLGMEVCQTAYAFDDPGPLGQVVFLDYFVRNGSGAAIDDVSLGLWVDPDVGDYTDDLVGCDDARDLGFGYNGASTDAVYGAAPPAVGIALIRGPAAGADTLPMTAFIGYRNGTDPTDYGQVDAFLHGLNADGTAIVDPTTGLTTRFMYRGDPVSGIGWIDGTAGDRRFLVGSGPFAMAAGEIQHVQAAVIVGQGISRLSSINGVRQGADAARELLRPSPPTPALISLIGANATTAGVRLRWRVIDAGARVVVDRREPDAAWGAIATLAAGAGGDLEYEDRAVTPGHRYGYRIGVAGADGSVAHGGEVWVDVPGAPGLALAGFAPNPASRAPVIAFSLPGAGPARLTVWDLAGRRMMTREVGSLGPGAHTIAVAGDRAFPPGLYLVRLEAAGRRIVARGVVLP